MMYGPLREPAQLLGPVEEGSQRIIEVWGPGLTAGKMQTWLLLVEGAGPALFTPRVEVALRRFIREAAQRLGIREAFVVELRNLSVHGDRGMLVPAELQTSGIPAIFLDPKQYDGNLREAAVHELLHLAKGKAGWSERLITEAARDIIDHDRWPVR